MAFSGIPTPVPLSLNPEQTVTGVQDTYRIFRSLSQFLTAIQQQLYALQTYINSGYPLVIKEGQNASMGVATLVAGGATIFNTSVVANTRIFLTPQETGVMTAFVRVTARSPGVSFTISTLGGADTAQIAWLLIQPE